MICSACHGEGRQPLRHEFGRGWVYNDLACRDCGGTGRQSPPQPPPATEEAPRGGA